MLLFCKLFALTEKTKVAEKARRAKRSPFQGMLITSWAWSMA